MIISGKAALSLTTAEEVILLSESCVISDNKLEYDVAAYMAQVFQADIDLESEVTAGEYLHYRMENTPYRSVRGEQRNIAPLKSGAKPQDWNQIDEETLPLVKDAIRRLQGDGITRPKKVTVFAVEKMVHLSSKRISLYLPKCLAEIQCNQETQEQYWAREIVWAVRQVENTGATLTWCKVRDLTNMRRRDFEACLPYVPDYADRELAETDTTLIVSHPMIV